MRKFLTVALAALVAVVAAGVATGQQSAYPLPNISEFDASITPTAAGTKKKPKNSTLRLHLRVPKEARATADTITFLLPRHVRVSGKGFRYCPFTEINTEGVSGCPKGSKVGSGTATAAFGPNLTPINFAVQLFVGSEDELAVHLQAQGLPIQKAIRGIVSRAGSPYFQKVTIIIPPELQRQLGAYVYLTGIDATIRGKAKKRVKGKTRRYNLISTIGCPKDKKHRFEARVHYVPNPNPPATADVSRGDTSACRGKP